MAKELSTATFPAAAQFSAQTKFRVPGKIESIAGAVAQVMHFIAASWPAGATPEIELSVQEAFANAVVHGCKNDPAQAAECLVACDAAHGLLIVVRDPGPGFEPASKPNADLYDSHGRGLLMIRGFMDEVRFAHGGAEIQMRKYAAPPDATPA